MNSDEGFCLDGAMRVLRGQVPYRDFFSHLGPLPFWTLAGLLGIFGDSLRAVRLLPACEIAAQTAAIYWCTAQFARRGIAVAAAVCFLVFASWQAGMMVYNHRWDSVTYAMLAATLSLSCIKRPSSRRAFFAGVLAALAAWTTPPVLLVTLTLLGWFAIQRSVVPHIAGVAAVSAVIGGVLLAQGALLPLIHHLLWSGANYGSANKIPYGWIADGYLAVVHGTRGFEFFIACLIVAGISLGATLPILNWIAWTPLLTAVPYRRAVLLMLSVGTALVISTLPRWDIGHLQLVTAPQYVLAGWLISELLDHATWSRRLAVGAATLAMIITPLFFINSLFRRGREVVFETRVGPVRAVPAHLAFVQRLQQTVKPGDRFFVYPIMPILYFFTGGVNATRYPLLQPGAMSDEDERSALNDLTAEPPRFVAVVTPPDDTFLKNWPNTDPNRLHMKAIESFLADRYTVIESDRYTYGKILEKRNP
jgi:hypothetical protein